MNTHQIDKAISRNTDDKLLPKAMSISVGPQISLFQYLAPLRRCNLSTGPCDLDP